MSRNIVEMVAKYELVRGTWIVEAREALRSTVLSGRAREIAYRTLIRWQEKSRSPIEEQVAAALIVDAARRDILVWDPRCAADEPSVFVRWLPDIADVAKIDARLNRRIDRFVFDFTLEGFGRRAAVECDSLAWHWGRAIEKDRAKDKFAEELHYRMFRFLSKRIIADRAGCAREVLDYVIDGRLP